MNLDLIVMAVTFVAFAIVLTWGVVRINLRLADQNRDQLKAILALSGNPAAAALAQTMESGDRVVPAVPIERRPRLAGS